MASLPNKLVLLIAGLVASLALALPAAAAAEPNTTLAVQAPGTALLGSIQEVNLKANNPKGEKRGYNLTFRDVLPKGVRYVAGSAPVAPRILADAPVTGKTTLIFENVADLSGSSEYNLHYKIEVEPSAYTVNQEFENKAEAFVSRKPRTKPSFNAKGEAETSSYTGSAESKATTKLSAIEIVKSEPSPEREILRGLHEHQTVYTLTVKNNELKPTKDISVEDYVPAGLEYLACDEADHTTNAVGTNPGSTEEYAGAGPINAAGNLPAAKAREHCLKPSEVETEEVDPPGPQEKGIYTHVVWNGIGELGPGEKREIQYFAAVPIRRNALFTGAKPTATSLGQAANLDNNTGAETFDEEALINVAQVKGTFVGGPKTEEQPSVSDTDEMTRTAEDLAVQKSVDNGEINEGQISTWTMRIESSEYRYVNDVNVDDTLPNGLCPLGSRNYEEATQVLAECDPTENKRPSAEYTSVEEQPDGSFKIHWDQSTDPELAHLPPSTVREIKFPTKTRVFYQQNFESAKPILTGDSWENVVDIVGENFVRCAPNDPNCTGLGARIYPHTSGPVPVIDRSEATQQAGGVTIDKTVRENDFSVVPTDCSGTYVDGKTAPFPKYRPGDKVCWQLRVDFAANLYTGTPAVTDFLPPNEKYLAGSAHKVEGTNTVESTFDESEASGGSLEWTLGESVVSGEKVFAWRFATEMQKSLGAVSSPKEITGNLMKFTYSNTNGKTFPLRDRAEIERTEPSLELKKEVASVNGGAASTTVKGGDEVRYAIKIPNTKGTLAAEEIEVWDNLPAGTTCANLVESAPPSNGGECTGSRIVWKGISVAAGATGEVSYTMSIPTDVAPGHRYENQVGVVKYSSPTNTGEKFTYIPTNNINPSAGTANTGELRAAALVTTTAATVSKTAVAPLVQQGNSVNQATIGELVKYTVVAKVPANSTVYGTPFLKDTIPAGLEFEKGSAKAEVGTEPIPTGGYTLTENKTGEAVTSVEVKFPETVASGSSETKITLTFNARVKNIASNVRGVEIANTAVLTYKDKVVKEGETAPTREAKSNTTKTPLVEPELKVYKTQSATGTVKPGQQINYTVSAEDVPSRSTANSVVLVDTVPAGMKIVGALEKGGTYDPVSRKITWELGTVNPGAVSVANTRSYTLEVENPARATMIFTNEVVGTTQSIETGQEGAPGRTSTFEEGSYKAAESGYRYKAAQTSKLVGATIAKTVEPGEGTIGTPLTYTVTMSLPRGIEFFNTTVVDTLPEGVAYDRTVSTEVVEGATRTPNAATLLSEKPEGTPQRLGWYFGTLPSSAAERQLVVVLEGHVKAKTAGGTTVKAGDKLINTVSGLYNGEDKGKPGSVPTPGAGSGFSEETGPATAETKVVEPALAIVKSVEAKPGIGAGSKVQPGSSFVYKLLVTNTGGAAAYGVKVTDTNPQADLRNLVPVANPKATLLTTKPGLSWEIAGPIAANGGTVTLEYKAELAPSAELHKGDKIENVAAIPSYFGVPAGERKENVEYRTYSAGPSTVTLNVALPELALKKTAGPGGLPEAEARIGQAFPWQIEVSNKSTFADAKAVNVLDKLPSGWEYVSGSSKIVGVGSITDPALVGGELEWATNRALAHESSFKLTFEAKPSTSLVKAPGTYVNEARTVGQDASGASASADGAYEAKGSAKANLKVPVLGITKTPDEGPAVAGADAAYSIAVTNSGGAPATEVEVTDVLGKGNEYTAGKATASPAAGFTETSVEANTPAAGMTTVHWKVATLAAAAGGTPGKVTITVPVHVAPTVADGEKVSDVASASSAEKPTAVEDGGSLKVTRNANLLVEKTTTATSVVAGETIEYNLHVENEGPSEAEGAVLSDPLPSGTELVSADAPCAEAAGGGKVVCELGNLPLSFTHDYKVVLRVKSGTTGSVVNKATLTSPTAPGPSGDKRESEVSTPISPQPALSITKTGPQQPVLLGSTFGYTLTVTNNGPSDAVGVEVKDQLPSQLELVSAESPCGESASALVTCKFARLEPKATETRHLTVKAIGIPAGGVPVKNTAKVTSETEGGVVHEGSAETVVLPAADLAIKKTAPATVEPDGTLTYNLHVVNLGPSIAHAVTVTDPLPAGVDLLSASKGCANVAAVLTCTVGTGELAVGEAADLQVVVHVPFALGGLPLVNTAGVKGAEGDPHTENDLSTVTTTVGPAADLSIVKTMGKAEAGKPLTYTLAILNRGPSAANPVTVTDTLPAGTTYRAASPSQGSCSASGQLVTCGLGELAAAGSAQVSITVDVSDTAPGALRNVAKVEAPQPDPDRSNNESAVEGPVTPLPPAASPARETDAPNLKVVKTVSTQSPQVGTPFDYQVTVSNMGDADAKEVKVLDTLNGPIKVVSIETNAGKCEAAGSRIECTIRSVPVGKSVHIDYAVIAEATGPLSNTASAQASNGEKAPANNHAVKGVKAKASNAAAGAKANFTLTKTAAKKVVRGGGKDAFTIALHNGATALVNATVCDRLPAALVFVKAPGASFVDGEACWRKKYVAAHKVLKLHLLARAVRGFKPLTARNVASAKAENAPGTEHAAATVRIKPAFAGAPGGVTG